MKKFIRTMLLVAIFSGCVNITKPISEDSRRVLSGLVGVWSSLFLVIINIGLVEQHGLFENYDEMVTIPSAIMVSIIAGIVSGSFVYNYFSDTPENQYFQILSVIDRLSVDDLVAYDFKDARHLLDYINYNFKKDKPLVFVVLYIKKMIKYLNDSVISLDKVFIDILNTDPDALLYEEIKKIKIEKVDLNHIDYLEGSLKSRIFMNNRYLVLAGKLYQLRDKITDICCDLIRKKVVIINSQEYKDELNNNDTSKSGHVQAVTKESNNVANY